MVSLTHSNFSTGAGTIPQLLDFASDFKHN